MVLEMLLERCEKLLPDLSKRALETERLRQLPRANVDALVASGLPRALQPERFGGSELGCAAHIEIASRLALGCASTAWCQFVWSAHNYLLRFYPERAQQEVWSEPESLIAGSLSPAGKAQPVEGGFRLSGRWSFASGCDAADWILLGAMAEVEGIPGPILCCVPQHEVEIIDNWFVTGLRGTGSKDIGAEEVFVPSHLAPSWTEVLARNQAMAVAVIAGPVLGAAEAALECFRKRLETRVLLTGTKQSELGTSRKRLAESAAEIAAARLLLEQAGSQIDATEARGDVPSRQDNVRWIRDAAYCAELCTRATQRVFEASGGGALQETEPIQRYWRDVNAGHAHLFLSWDAAAENWAASVLEGIDS
ncbi:hypothetical protein MK489_13670 [Myxococcota bacterium]|nr:hypothetical protein [Myxococcota bacterium]